MPGPEPRQFVPFDAVPGPVHEKNLGVSHPRSLRFFGFRVFWGAKGSGFIGFRAGDLGFRIFGPGFRA